MKKYSAMVAIIMVTAGALAEEGGEALLTIGGVEQVFRLSPSSDFSGSPQYPSVSMSLAAPRENNATDVASISLGFEFSTTSEDVSSAEARLFRRAGEKTETLYCHDEAERGGLTVTIEEQAIEGNFMSVKGRFSGNFGASENYGRDVDLSSPVPVSGEFTVTLERLAR
jgi:hypothetical protein